MRRLWIIIFLIILSLSLLVIIFWLYRQLKPETSRSGEQKIAYPYFPVNSETYLDKEKTWLIKSFQPEYKEFEETETNKYLVVSDGKEIVKVFLGAQIPYIDETAKTRIINREELKQLLKPGERFGVNYLAEFPTNFSLQMPYCQNQKIECLLAYFKKESDEKGEKVFYPLMIYRALKQ